MCTYLTKILYHIHTMHTVVYNILTIDFAFWYLIGPHAHPGFAVVSQTRRTLVSASLSSPTVPEGITLDIVREDSV